MSGFGCILSMIWNAEHMVPENSCQKEVLCPCLRSYLFWSTPYVTWTININDTLKYAFIYDYIVW